MSVLLEWNGFELSPDEGHLNLGWDRALQALDRTAADPPVAGPELPPDADAYFRADRVGDGSALDAGFSILVGLEGSGTLHTEGGDLPFARGSAVLVPYAAGPGELRGDVSGIRCRPPDPAAGEGRW
jgi:mannose-6-phosphate isomerase